MPSFKGTSVLIVGGAGFIGSHLAEELARSQLRCLIVVDNLSIGRESHLDDARRTFPLAWYVQDAGDEAKMREIVRRHDVEVIFNLAVVPLPTSLERPRFAVEQTVAPTLVCCELARRREIKTLIQFSSSEVYGTAQYVPMDEQHPTCPQTPYAASKLATDALVLSYQRTFGIDATVIRPFNNLGPRQHDGAYAGIIPKVIRQVQRGEAIEIYGDGEQTRDFVFVTDTARAAVAAYCQPQTRGKIINIGSGEEISVNRLVELLLQTLGTNGSKVRHVSPRPGDVRRHCADIDLAKRLLAFKPTVTIQEGLRQTVSWYAQRDRQALPRPSGYSAGARWGRTSG